MHMVLTEYFFSFDIFWKLFEFTINLFHAAGLFLYPVQTSENKRFSDAFRGYRKRPGAWIRLIEALLPLWEFALKMLKTVH